MFQRFSALAWIVCYVAATTCNNPTDHNFQDALIICSSTDNNVCLGVSPGEEHNPQAPALNHTWVTMKSLHANSEKGLDDEKLPWHLECQESTGAWILRHAHFYHLCVHQPEPKRYPYRRFLQVGDCTNHTNPDLLRLTVDYSAETQLSELRMFPKEEFVNPEPVDGFCLSTSKCVVDDRQNCNPLELLDSDKSPAAGSLPYFTDCVDGAKNQEFVVTLAPSSYRDNNPNNPTSKPTISPPTPKPTVSPTAKVHAPPTPKPSLPPTYYPSLSPTLSPVISDGSIADREGDEKQDEKQEDEPGPGTGLTVFIIILLLVVGMFVYIYRRRIHGWRTLRTSKAPYRPDQINRGGKSIKFDRNGLTTISLDEDAPLINI